MLLGTSTKQVNRRQLGLVGPPLPLSLQEFQMFPQDPCGRVQRIKDLEEGLGTRKAESLGWPLDLSPVEPRGPCEASGTLALLPADDPGRRGGGETR